MLAGGGAEPLGYEAMKPNVLSISWEASHDSVREWQVEYVCESNPDYTIIERVCLRLIAFERQTPPAPILLPCGNLPSG